MDEQKITRGFPVTSPVYEVRQFRKSRQTMVERLSPKTLIRFSSANMNGERGGDANSLYATLFVIERLDGDKWVACSKVLGQGELCKRLCIVLEGDADDPAMFDRFDPWDKPLIVLIPANDR